jgi:hypothetical protein
MIRISIIVSIAVALVSFGCEKKEDKPSNAGTAQPSGSAAKPTAKPESAASAPAKGPGHGGGVIELGETTVGGMKVRASRDEGEIKAGGDSPIDIWVDGGLGNAAGVRFWIGTQDARGSIKAKAAVEDGHWHTHGEVPNPIPPDSKLWVEIEGKDGKNTVVSFDLKK